MRLKQSRHSISLLKRNPVIDSLKSYSMSFGDLPLGFGPVSHGEWLGSIRLSIDRHDFSHGDPMRDEFAGQSSL